MRTVWIEPRKAKRKKPFSAFFVPFLLFLVIPSLVDGAILTSVLLRYPFAMEVIRTGFIVPIVLFVAMAFYFPSRRYELILYFLVVYLTNSFLIVYLDTIKTDIVGFIGNGLFVFLSPWLIFAVLGIVYFPVKLGFDLNVKENPLQKSEEGHFSNNRLVRLFQFQGTLPLTKPRGVLISIYGFLAFCSVLVVIFLKWQEKT